MSHCKSALSASSGAFSKVVSTRNSAQTAKPGRALRVPAALLLVLFRLAGFKPSCLDVFEILSLPSKQNRSACRWWCRWWGLGLHHLLEGYKNRPFPHISLNSALRLHRLLGWWPALPLVSRGWSGQTPFWLGSLHAGQRSQTYGLIFEWSQGLVSVTLIGSFQLRIFYGSVISDEE